MHSFALVEQVVAGLRRRYHVRIRAKNLLVLIAAASCEIQIIRCRNSRLKPRFCLSVVLVFDTGDHPVVCLTDGDRRRNAILVLAELRRGLHVVTVIVAFARMLLQIAQNLQDLLVAQGANALDRA